MRIQWLRIHGLKHRIASWGNPRKPPILFLHGWLDTGLSLHFTCSQLEQDFYCIAPDLRGYGRSEHISNPLGYFFMEYVADVTALIERLFSKKTIHLVGHSLGGAIAGLYAGLHPQRLKSFINLEGFIYRDPPLVEMPDRVLKWMEQSRGRRFRVYKNVAKFADRLQKNNPRLPQDRALFIAKHLVKKTARGVIMAADTKHKMIEPYWLPLEVLTTFWGRIQAPTLLVAADLSEMGVRFAKGKFLEEAKNRGKFFPRGTQFKVMQNCGHMIHHEQPAALASLIREFVGAI